MNPSQVQQQIELEPLIAYIEKSDFSTDVKERSKKILNRDDLVFEQKMFEINELINEHINDVLDRAGVPPVNPEDPEVKQAFEDHKKEVGEITSNLEKDMRFLFDAADQFASQKAGESQSQ